MDYLYYAYGILSKIYGGGYSEIELNEGLKSVPEQDKPIVTRLVYGVLSKDIELNYLISSLCDKPPKQSVGLILKLGMYALKYMDSIPAYAAVNNTVELAKKLGKGGVSGFINAVLKRSQNFAAPPPQDDLTAMSVKYNYPVWLVRRYIKDFGKDGAAALMSASFTEDEHLRIIRKNYTLEQAKAYLKRNAAAYRVSQAGGLLTRLTTPVKSLLAEGKAVIMSLCSVLVSDMLGVKEGDSVLDLCAAPGGKSVYMAELAGSGRVTACDIHPHRLELIRSYAETAGADNVDIVLNDAAVLKSEWVNKFDRVLCDVPCSGLGVAGKRPDILFNRTEEGLAELPPLQYAILLTGARYVKPGGALVYSTCTTVKAENEAISDRFTKEHPEFIKKEVKRFTPDTDGHEGFFAAAFVKKA